MTDSIDKDFDVSEEGKEDFNLDEEKPRRYVVHTYTGYENKVRDKIQSMIDNDQNPDIVDVTVPTEEYVEVKNNSKTLKTRKLFPGYVMVKMHISNKSWYIIRNTQGVTGFVGPDSKPVALTPAEVKKFGIKDKVPIVNVNFEVGDEVQIISGPFADMVAKVDSIDLEKQTAMAYVDMFGRDTLVDLNFEDVRKI